MFGYHGQSQYQLIFHQNCNIHVARRHDSLYIIIGRQNFILTGCEFQLRFKPKRKIHISETTLALQAHTSIHGQPEFGFAALVDPAGEDEIEDRARTAGLGEPRQGFDA